MKQVDLEVAATARRLDGIASEARSVSRDLAGLEEDMAADKASLADAATQLASGIRWYAANRSSSRFKLLLGLDELADARRLLRYHSQLVAMQEARARSTLDQLRRAEAKEQELLARRTALEYLRRDTAARSAELAAQRARQAEQVAALEQEIDASDAATRSWLQREQRMVAKITQPAAPVPGDVPTSPAGLGAQQGRLPWPLPDTRIIARAGHRSAAGITWPGVVLEADPGAEVTAIEGGTVVFADWFGPLGLLLIVDHGDGYMSLYGHNEVLLRQVGEAVGPGETLAKAGRTGGTHAGLYFEIRHNGKALDPSQWCRG